MAPTHAAFLRAINLGATRKASGEQLRAAFQAAGLDEIASFRNSGNIVFAGSGRAAELTGAIEGALRSELGFEVPVFLRTAAQLRAIAAQEPFPPRAVAASKGKPQVVLLPRKPAATAARAVLALANDEDRLAIEGSELYWLPAAGTQGSALDMKAIDRALGFNTMRTMGTIEGIAAKYFVT